ncbi:SGNH/GDSL hydrolase family protein [Vibrio marisflavi]|uniref:SGNH/GDSL hydrolase family protein n=1 Tax=Vibrio marisflavi TaxID=1216040 RepID=UPI001F02EBD5|nr:SGNH/GDSL hydrolase family protein [Vibrio marisflavi]
MFFGDSLTDTGNYPEPENLRNPQLKNFNLYVPITNPVPMQYYGKNGYPSLSFLQKSIPHQGLIDGEPKALFSINWPLYLASDLKKNELVSWYQYVSNGTGKSISLNYAWASAIANGNAGCFHDDGSLFAGECSEYSLLGNREKYVKHTENNDSFDKSTDYEYEDLQIPNLAEQIELYYQETDSSQRSNAKVFIFIGGNDISNFLKSKLIRMVIEPSSFFDTTIESKMNKVADSVLRAVTKIRIQTPSAKIYILTLPKFSNLYAGHSYQSIPLIGGKIVSSLNYAVSSYNNALKSRFSGLKNIQVIDSGEYLDNVARTPLYKSSVEKGSACFNDPSGDYMNPLHSNNNCVYGPQSNHSYFSWNNAHYSSSVNKGLANYVLKTVTH